MPKNTHLNPYRSDDAIAILETLATGQPVAVVGLSNFGKSTLLRHISGQQITAAYREMAGQAAIFVYVDCNRMLEMSAQGFYEVILRSVLETLSHEQLDRASLAATIEELYQKVVESKSTFTIPLAFNDAIITLMEDNAGQDVILMLDEFDAVLTGLDERVFLNLRALKDKYVDRLNYVTATQQPLSAVGGGDDLAEFLELFVAHKYDLQPLNPDDATELAAEIFRQANDSLDPPERDYILEQAGGHPGLIQAVAHVVMEVESGAPATYTQQALSVAGDVLQNHRLVRIELGKLWKQLLPEEAKASAIAATHGIDALTATQQAQLIQRGLLVQDQTRTRLFAQLFAHYARRQALVQQDIPSGVWVDVDAGTVWVAGQMIDPLTDLEYRLLLLLYGRLDKICDKYQIVETVWGQDYLGEVDDARIEKLISRLRAKVEPDPSAPRFISTVRGRGYKLNSTPRS
ncbi:MAG: winged helix-turn-helix domain-containing protein [Anaerolineae bacterium]|jgi:DNA-binding winged helix-turn-helix (wHTH) protein|nr:winged helix-turn-helix domain-containing protein [Anaerolineae bacterium]